MMFLQVGSQGFDELKQGALGQLEVAQDEQKLLSGAAAVDEES